MPLATCAGAATALALTAPRPTAVVDARVPVAGALAHALAALGDGAAVRAAAIVLVAAAATVIGALVAGARAGWPGRLAGVVAAGWLIACPPVRALAAGLAPGTVALVALAVVALAIDRIARGGGAVSGRALGAAGATAVLVEARAWPVVLLGAALVLYRARRGARWAASAALVAAASAVVWLVPAALAGGPRWPGLAQGAGDLGRVVDELGPLALALAAAGALAALGTRGDRWLCAAIAAVAVAGAPGTTAVPAGLIVAVALAAGLAVASLLARAPALRHQLVTAGSVLALIVGAVAWA